MIDSLEASCPSPAKTTTAKINIGVKHTQIKRQQKKVEKKDENDTQTISELRIEVRSKNLGPFHQNGAQDNQNEHAYEQYKFTQKKKWSVCVCVVCVCVCVCVCVQVRKKVHYTCRSVAVPHERMCQQLHRSRDASKCLLWDTNNVYTRKTGMKLTTRMCVCVCVCVCVCDTYLMNKIDKSGRPCIRITNSRRLAFHDI